MAVKAINGLAGPDELVPALVVYGSLPRLWLSQDPPTPSTVSKATALQKDTTAMPKHFANRQVRSAIRTQSGPHVYNVHSIPTGSHVLVYHPSTDRWDGPYCVLDIDGEEITVLVPPPSGPSMVRTTALNRFVHELVQQNADQEGIKTSNITASVSIVFDICWAHDALHDIDIHIEKRNVKVADNVSFLRSRKQEFHSLAERGVFSIVSRTDAQIHRVLESRFDDTLKNTDILNDFANTRFVVGAFKDENYGMLAYTSTVQCSSLGLSICLCAMNKDLHFFSRNIFKAYVQCDTINQRQILRAPLPYFVWDLILSSLLRNSYTAFPKPTCIGFKLTIYITVGYFRCISSP